MSSSLTKRKPLPQKENLNRLSNSKIMNAYSGTNLVKINCSDFSQPYLSTNFQQKLKTNTKRTGRLKTGRKHQMSVEFILSNKIKQPYSVRNLHPHPDCKLKPKKKKKDKGSNESSKFIIPIGQFSKSNSLIVFSEKDSTIGANLFNKDKNPFFSQKYSPSQAAIIIQKTWRGFLTRKLLDQYIADEESKLNSVIKRIRSKEESFELNEHQAEELHFSQFSSINEGTANINDLRKQSPENDEHSTNAKHYPLFTTSQESSTKEQAKCESPVQYRSFFRNHKTEVDNASCQLIQPIKTLPNLSKKSLVLQSSLYNLSLCNKVNEHRTQEDSLSDKLASVSSHIQSCFKDSKKQLKQLLQSNQLDLPEMIQRTNKIKEIYESSQSFMRDVHSQILAILQDMRQITQNGGSPSSPSSQNKNQPRSQLFTIQMDQNQPQLPSNYFGFKQGQLKLQSYLNELIEQYNQNHCELSQLQFLCEILKVNSERGVKNIVERCLIQFTVEMITENFPLQELNHHIYKLSLGQSKEQQFLKKWIEQLGKWDMGTIHQVTQAMQSSSFINGQNSKSFINQKNE